MERQYSEEDIEKAYRKIKSDAESYGYNLNPEEDFTRSLVKGLVINTGRYGYQSCPCRLSTAKIEEDRDIICPCDYRDADLNDYGACYCGLYVDRDIKNGVKKLKPIPERRFLKQSSEESRKEPDKILSVPEKIDSFVRSLESKKIGIWRCKVCGYLCARENPPEICPICKVGSDRFERLL